MASLIDAKMGGQVGELRIRDSQLSFDHAQDGSHPSGSDSLVESATQARSSAVLLADAFSEFISASSRLENSYRELQKEVSELGLELAERNAALNSSLAENERMRLALQQIVDSMPCGVLVLDHSGTISMINPESRRMLGIDVAKSPAAELTTLRQISVHSGVNLESFYESESSSDTQQEFCIRDTSGKRWLEIRNRGLFRESSGSVGGSKPDQTILILRDITAQKRAEQEREAGRKAMALAEITTILAHEIRNPLASLELFAGLIESDGERRQEWVSNLHAGIRSLSGTVNNVLSFHGSGALQLTPVRLSEVIGNAIDFIQPIADQAAVSLQWSVPSRQLLVMGNASALHQVVLNLLSNAIRHTPAGGSVTISLRTEAGVTQVASQDEGPREEKDRAVVEFSDTGCGIGPDQIGHVFEPGFSGSGDSSGLGLAVCDRIMKQHGGRISVSSPVPGSVCDSVHSGARFVLDFPVLPMELATA